MVRSVLNCRVASCCILHAQGQTCHHQPTGLAIAVNRLGQGPCPVNGRYPQSAERCSACAGERAAVQSPLTIHSIEAIFVSWLGTLNTQTNLVTGGKVFRRLSRSPWRLPFTCWKLVDPHWVFPTAVVSMGRSITICGNYERSTPDVRCELCMRSTPAVQRFC